jgi:hypothetical protein
MSKELNLGWKTTFGTPYQVGSQLGEIGRYAMHQYVIKTTIWQQVTDPKHKATLERMAENTQRDFPDVWEELKGLAAGLELTIDDVFAWNCRGDLIVSVPDGCTTVQLNDDELTIAHNEDGMPILKGHCFIAKVKVDNQAGFISFCYPGSIPGHTFAITDKGLVQAVNNLRLIDCHPNIPRMVLGRALLSCELLDEALELIKGNSASGGFHFSLCQQGDDRLISLEFGAGTASADLITSAAMHANHAIHEDFKAVPQWITDSSHDRQIQGDNLVTGPAIDPLTVLWDSSGKGLPIYRNQPDDPDDENTLATAVIRVNNRGIDWKIYDQAFSKPVYFGHQSDSIE